MLLSIYTHVVVKLVGIREGGVIAPYLHGFLPVSPDQVTLEDLKQPVLKIEEWFHS